MPKLAIRIRKRRYREGYAFLEALTEVFGHTIKHQMRRMGALEPYDMALILHGLREALRSFLLLALALVVRVCCSTVHMSYAEKDRMF